MLKKLDAIRFFAKVDKRKKPCYTEQNQMNGTVVRMCGIKRKTGRCKVFPQPEEPTVSRWAGTTVSAADRYLRG